MTHRWSEWTNLSPEMTDLFLDSIFCEREKKKRSKKTFFFRRANQWNAIDRWMDHDIFITLVLFFLFSTILLPYRDTHLSSHSFIIISVSLKPFPSQASLSTALHISLALSSFSFTNRELLCNQTRLEHVTIDANEKEWVNERGSKRKNTDKQIDVCAHRYQSLSRFIF